MYEVFEHLHHVCIEGSWLEGEDPLEDLEAFDHETGVRVLGLREAELVEE